MTGAVALLVAGVTIAVTLVGTGDPPPRANITVAGATSSTAPVTPRAVTSPTTSRGVTATSTPANSGGRSPSTTTPIPAVTAPKATPNPTIATTTTTIASTPATVGTVTDAAGNPVSDAYVIGMTDLSVARTDADGHYSMPCTVQKLVAATWILPVMTAGTTALSYGHNTTEYEPPPVTSGSGYVFSGGASDVSQASPVACDGNPVDFRLPVGGTVDITWVIGSGSGDDSGTTTTTNTSPQKPADNLYLPGLDSQAAPETAPVSGTGHQIISQLGPGAIRVDGTGTPFSCSGIGVAGTGSTFYVTVSVGAITSVTCTTG
jgi:hypothetical protein